MDPLNKKEIKSARWHFILVYGASLILPFAAAAFLFRTPTDALEQENARLRQALSEQVLLNEHLATMVTGLQRLGENDKAYISTTNDLERGTLKRHINEHENIIQSSLYELKRDTAAFQADSTKQFSAKVITLVDAALSYRNTISYLRDLLERNGVNTQSMDRLNSELNARNEKIRMLELLVAQRPEPVAAARSESRSASDCSGFQAKLQVAQEEIGRLRATGSQRGTSPQQVHEEALRERYTHEFVAMLVRKGDDARKSPCARRPFYELAIETLSQLQPSRPETTASMADLHKKIRRISD